MKKFGAACFNFSLKKIPGKTITVKEYIQEIEVSLNKINNVSNVSIDCLDADRDENISLDDAYGYKDHCFGAYPQVSFLKVVFDVYLPYRVQAEVTNGSEFALRTKSENFRIYIFEYFYGMVSYVEIVNCKEDSSGTDAVRIIREFLKSEFNRLDTFIIFDCLGPSPFHADFRLIPKRDVDKITMERINRKGYDELLFSYDSCFYSNDEDALSYLFDELSYELSYFYSLVSIRVKFMYDWASIGSDLDSVFLLEKNKSGIFLFFRRKKSINDILKKIWVFKSEVMSFSGNEKREYDDIYKRREVFFLKDFVDEEIDGKYTYPVSDAKDLVDFFENKNSKSVELFITFITAIFGAVVGAAVTYLSR